MKQAQQTTSFRLAQLTASSCPPLLHANISGDSNCKGVNDSFLELVAMNHPDIVLLHSLWSTDNDPTRLRDTVKALKALNVPRVIVLGPVPNWKRGLPNALLNYYRMHQTIPDRLAKGFSGQDRDQQMAGISRQLGVEYISAWDAFCNMQGCMARSAANGNGTFFVDTVHLSTSGSKYLIDAIRKPLFGDADRPAAIR